MLSVVTNARAHDELRLDLDALTREGARRMLAAALKPGHSVSTFLIAVSPRAQVRRTPKRPGGRHRDRRSPCPASLPRRAPLERPPPAPTAHLPAACETGRHGACRGQVLSLRYQGPCECAHHDAPAPPEPAAA
jgi:hypothetical protein